MKKSKAMQVMSALSQSTRLEVLTRLTAAAPDGMAAGDLATLLKVTPSAMSAHLAILQRAEVINSKKAGRSVIYKAVPRTVKELVVFISAILEAEAEVH